MIGVVLKNLLPYSPEDIKLADFIEIRLDKLDALELAIKSCEYVQVLKYLKTLYAIPCLLTIPLTEEITADKKKYAVNFFLPYKLFDWVDQDIQETHIELSCAQRVYSWHGPFEDLYSVIRQPRKSKFFLYKFAVSISSASQGMKLLYALYLYKNESFCIVPWGEGFFFARIMSYILGRSWTYSNISLDQQVVFGQPSLKDWCEIYNGKSLNKDTKIFALIGDPIDKSQSHVTHNRVFKYLSLSAVYIKIPLQMKELKVFFQYWRRIPNCMGLSVTMPLKEKIASYLDGELTYPKAFNTVVKTATGKLEGFNTDGIGVVRLLKKRSPLLGGKKVVILGAGGTALAIIQALLEEYVDITVINRSLKRMDIIEANFAVKYYPLTSLSAILKNPYDILIQTTPVGFHNAQDCLLSNKDLIHTNSIIFECVYGETQLIKWAKENVYAFDYLKERKDTWEILFEELLVWIGK